MAIGIQSLADEATPFGFTVEGSWPETGLEAGLGSGGAGIGDFNGDGIDDVLINAVGLDNTSLTDAGGVYIIFGGTQLALAIASGQTFDPSPSGGGVSIGELQGNGILIEGALEFDQLVGTAAGDVNGDGFDDVLLMAPSFIEDPTSLTGFDHRPGTGYIIYGGPGVETLYDGTGLPRIDLGNLPGQSDGTPAVTTILGEITADRTGLALTGGGDLNGDGFADVALGTFQAPGYVYNPDGSLFVPPEVPDVPGLPTDLENASIMFGRIYGLYGNDSMPAVIDLTTDIVEGTGDLGFFTRGYTETVDDGEGGTTPSFAAHVGFFETLAMADLNNDGRDELLIGSPFGGTFQNLSDGIENNEFAPGGVFIIDGAQTASTPSEIMLRDQIFLEGETTGLNFTGWSVVNLGDVNADGIDDVGLSAPLYDDGPETNTGAVYGIFGDPLFLSGLGGVSSLSNETAFRIIGVNEGDAADPAFDLDSGADVGGGLFSATINGVGDLDGDGIDDFAVGFTNAQGGRGSVYVLRGRPDPGEPGADELTAFQDISHFKSGAPDSGILRLDGATDDQAGSFIAGGFDLNADGVSEIMIGAPGPFQLFPNGDQEPLTDGKVYVLSGFLGDNGATSPVVGGPSDDALAGDAADETIVGAEGTDSISGEGGNDILIGGLRTLPFDEIAGQVFRLYQATLDRTPDFNGLLGWVDALQNGSTLQSITSGFVNSPEFLAKYGSATNTEFVTLLYQNVLGRTPSNSEVSFWSLELETGARTRAEVVVGFSESPEFEASTAGPALGYTREAIEMSWTDDVFRLYQATLGREPNLPGLLFWNGELADGTPYLSAISSFVGSQEFQQKYGGLSDEEFVTLLYQNVLNRTPSPSETIFWTAELANSLRTREEVVQGFAQSPEFRAATAEPLADFMRGFAGDRLEGGPGDDAMFGGPLSDAFVFDATQVGSDLVLRLEAWDTLEFNGFQYAGSGAALARMTQTAEGVVFQDQGVTILFAETELSMMGDLTILV